MKMIGKFVVLEGISGSGKSTQANILSAQSPNSVLNVEPTHELFGSIIRAVYMREPVPEEAAEKALKFGKVSEIGTESAEFWIFAHHVVNQAKLKMKLGEFEMQMLFMADRIYDLEKNIIPALASEKTVIQDRYLNSTLAYGYSGGLDMEDLIKWQKKALASYNIGAKSWQPDLLVIFDLDPKVAMERLKNSGKKIDLFEETLARLEKIREGYQLLSKRTDIARKIVILDATRPKEEITTKLMELVSLESQDSVKTA